MATINISNLRPTGSDLFSDPESFMNYLSEKELSIQGGECRFIPPITASPTFWICRFLS